MALTETLHAGGFMLSGNPDAGNISCEQITVLSGTAAMVAGTVLGRVVAGTATEAHAGNTGTGAMGSITVGSGAQAGVYRVVFTQAVANAGNFEVYAPSGQLVGNGLVAVAFSGGGISFTIADATDFVVGDKFLVTVVLTSAKYTILTPAATDGSEVAAAILWDYCDASAADKQAAAVVRLAEVTAGELTWPAGITAGQKASATAQLAASSIVLR